MFEPARFLRLARAQWAEQWRGWAWFLGIGVIVHFVVLMLLLFSGDNGHRSLNVATQAGIFFAGLFITGTIFGGRYFNGMARRESAGLLLMRPASAFEKWLLALLVVVVAYPLAYALAFQVCNLPAALYAGGKVAADIAAGAEDTRPYLADWGRYEPVFPWQVFESRGAFLNVMLWLGTLQGFALLGSVYFRTMPFLKTIVAGFVLMLLLIFASVFGGDPDVFLSWWTPGMRERATEGLAPILIPLAWFAVPALTWLASLFALRERQVA